MSKEEKILNLIDNADLTNDVYRKNLAYRIVQLVNEKTPEGAYSYSLSLNTPIIADTLKDFALKLVANAHSEMSDAQWNDYLNEITNKYAKELSTLAPNNQ